MTRTEFAVAAVAAAVFACAFAYPIPARLGHVGVVWDWTEFLSRNWVSAHTMTRYGQIPLWNPYACGGMPLLAHPSSAVLSPLFILQILFGAEIGLALQIPFYLAIAWSGGYALGRVLGMSPVGAAACASLFPAASWFSLHVAVGHMNFLPEAYLPWIATVTILGLERGRWTCAIGGLLIALTFGAGGLYPSMHAVLLVTALSSIAAARKRTMAPVYGLLTLLVCAFGFAAVKLLPSLELIIAHPRPILDADHNSLGDLLRGVFSLDQYYDRERVGNWGFWEIGAYLSPIAVGLALYGTIRAPRRTAPWSIVAVMFFILALGGPEWWLPWTLLHSLPGFSSLRTPSRFLIPFTLAIGVLAGFGADLLARRKGRGAAAASLLVLLAVVNAWFVSRPNRLAPVVADAPPESPDATFRQMYVDPWSMFAITRGGEGALHCMEELDFSDFRRMKVIGSNEPGYRGEHSFIGAGTSTQSVWTPNHLRFAADSPDGGTLVVNQNYAPGWRLSEGSGEVFSEQGLLAVRVPAGRVEVGLVYRSDAFVVGLIITVLTCFIVALIWYRRRAA